MRDSQSSEIGVGRLMEVICGIREEQYPFQRYVALLTFSTWLGWPFASNVVKLGETVAAARVVLAIDHSEIKVPKAEREGVIGKISREAFTSLKVANALAEPCLEVRFRRASQEFNFSLWNVAAIAAFFMKCSLEMHPSLNKAQFFIDEGGFGGSIRIGKGETAKPYKVSPATLRKSWGALAVSSPFALSAVNQSVEPIFDLPPDGEDSIRKASKLLKNVQKLRDYFGYARYIQDTLLSRLDRGCPAEC
jgi:hypothetical protein